MQVQSKWAAEIMQIIILNLKMESNPTRNMAKFHCLIKHGCRLSVQEKTAQIKSNRLTTGKTNDILNI